MSPPLPWAAQMEGTHTASIIQGRVLKSEKVLKNEHKTHLHDETNQFDTSRTEFFYLLAR